ncbi:PREDICTED: centrosomal protein CEP57L1 [Buceros rhinoceros silvestris]|uniref:centrosomal protein CEP57L1 n=1 Tax=Buceros rhinoceros silvestris TaxID=175836 RepID=UPI000528D177|nr:PREDICTED: centrosomal protein CEP57L1 [Buceros rhinoceros silvestris]
MLPAAFACIESKKLAAIGGDRSSIPSNQAKAVEAALKTLQKKICRLELEKSQAEDNLCSLSIAAARYKTTLESCKKDIAHQELMQQRKDPSVQLNAAQSRCSLLEKQLDYMRKMVSSAELEQKMVLEQQKEEDQNWLELRAKLEKLEMLEKECLKLTATQRVTEDKIKRLEEKLCKEEHQRKLIQDKTAQLQTGFEISGILMTSVTSQNEKENGKKKKSKKRIPAMKKIHLSQLQVKAGDLPFVAGKSVSSSHSVSANVQSVMHILKHRNPRVSSQSQGGGTSGISRRRALSKSVCTCSTSPAATGSLSDLLLAIQDELGHMSFEHQELLKKIQQTQNSKVREDLEQELDWLVKQMEVKEEQISKLKKQQATVRKSKRKTQKFKQGAAHVKLNCGDQREAKEIAVTVRESMSKSCPGQKGRSSLQLLKNVQKLQSTLKKI